MSCYAAQFATTIFSNTVLQCWNNVVAIPNNVATMLRHCVALKIVVMNNIIVLCNISLRACCSRLVSLAEKELTTDSNWFGKERHGVILKVQLSTKAIWTNKKACLACPSLHPCNFTKMFSFFSS